MLQNISSISLDGLEGELLINTDIMLPKFLDAAQSGKLLSPKAIENLVTICGNYTEDQKDLAAATLDWVTENH